MEEDTAFLVLGTRNGRNKAVFPINYDLAKKAELFPRNTLVLKKKAIFPEGKKVLFQMFPWNNRFRPPGGRFLRNNWQQLA
jgi:hypothetical protein